MSKVERRTSNVERQLGVRDNVPHSFGRAGGQAVLVKSNTGWAAVGLSAVSFRFGSAAADPNLKGCRFHPSRKPALT